VARITDFQDDLDRIDLGKFRFATFEDAATFATEVSGDLVFNFTSGVTLTVDNMTLGQLDRDELIL
jgi:hypothetical protein